jgi:hypothetical protein
MNDKENPTCIAKEKFKRLCEVYGEVKAIKIMLLSRALHEETAMRIRRQEIRDGNEPRQLTRLH